MILRKLRIANIRSHVFSEIVFEEGFNCVVGGVGAGKSSLLYALHFALFGEPLHRSYDYLIREGENTGKVYLEFEHVGKIYKITRTLRRERGGISQDMGELRFYQDDELIAWGKAGAVQEQLRELTGLDKRVFEEFVWIQQEKLKDLLIKTPAERQRILDEIFGLSDFQKAWDKLLPYQRGYEAVRDTLGSDPDVLGIADLKKQYSELSIEIMNLQIELETLKIDLGSAEKQLLDAESRLKELEIEEKQIAELARERSALTASIAENKASLELMKTKLTHATQEVKRIKDSLYELGELEGGSIKRLASLGATKWETMEDLTHLAGELEAKIVDVRRRMTEFQTAERKSKATLQALQDSSVCPLCRRALEYTYRDQLSEELKREIYDYEQQTSLLSQELKKLETQYNAFKETMNEITNLGMQIRSCKENLEAAQRREAELKTEVEERETSLREKLLELKSIESRIAGFNIEALESARKVREDALLKYRWYVERIQSQERRIGDKRTILEALEKRLRNAEEKLKRKGNVEKIVKLVKELRNLYKDVTPTLRSIYIEGLRNTVQSELDALMAESGRNFHLTIDNEYTPVITEAAGHIRDASFISGGERTWLALAYRIGLGQLVTEARTGHCLDILILDEPTESLGSEDGSIEALSAAISGLKNISQIIIVTHSTELAEKAPVKFLVEKVGGVSKIKKI
ncbi:MAG: SMC family ATPase [Candidatus Bathyarchaeia archaeon]